MRPGRRRLRPGCSGRDVAALQRKLGIHVDGSFGPKTADAVRAWKRHHYKDRRKRGPVVTRNMWRRLGFSTKEWWPVRRTSGLTPGQVVNRIVMEAQGLGFPHMSVASVRDANHRHGPTSGGNRSDHQGPPHEAWAADFSNASHPTVQMDRLARKIARWFGGSWGGAGVTNWYHDGLRFQMLYRTTTGGNHYNHVHLGVRKY